MRMRTLLAKTETPGTGLGRAEALLGVMFTTPKELRHQAEQALGLLFVPTEPRSAGETSAVFVLRPAGMGEVHVHARRERHGHPYRVTHVDAVP